MLECAAAACRRARGTRQRTLEEKLAGIVSMAAGVLGRQPSLTSYSSLAMVSSDDAVKEGCEQQ